jgi:hypothetical protein
MTHSSSTNTISAESNEDQLGFMHGVAFALPISLGLWAMAIWAVFRFVF